MMNRALGSWKYIPDNWSAREAFLYRSQSKLARLEFQWELTKTPLSDGAIVRARACASIPFKREQIFTWTGQFLAQQRGSVGFEFFEERNETRGSVRRWRSEGDRVILEESDSQTVLVPPEDMTVFHVLQAPALLRAPNSVESEDPLMLVVSGGFQAVRVHSGAGVSSGQWLALEAVKVREHRSPSVEWSESNSAEILWDDSFRGIKEVRVKAPILGAITLSLVQHEKSDK